MDHYEKDTFQPCTFVLFPLARLETRLCDILRGPTNRFLSFLNVGTPIVFEPRAPNGETGKGKSKGPVFFDAAVKRCFTHDEIPLYTISKSYYIFGEDGSGAETRKFSEEMTVESDIEKLGALTWCDVDITSVAWACVDVRPCRASIPEHQLKVTNVFSHDIFVLYTSSGPVFVYDPSGYQFGFGDYLHRWGDYVLDFVEDGTFCDPVEEMMRMDRELVSEGTRLQALRAEMSDSLAIRPKT